MAYTDGAVHTLAGSGVLSIAAPIGVRWHVTARPSYLGSRPGQPLSIEGMGRFAFGDASSFGNDVELTHVDQLVYPLVGGVTRMGYTLENGVAATLTELVQLPDRTTLAVYDRNPVPVGVQLIAWNPGPTALASAWVYTVPAGKRFQLTTARVQHVRLGANPAASLNTAFGSVVVDGIATIAQVYLGAPVSTLSDSFIGPIYLPAGTTIRGQYSNSEAGTAVYTLTAMAGTLFDA